MSSNATSLGWQPEPSVRGTTAILTSCLSTLIFSAWSAVHIGVTWEGSGAEPIIRTFWLFIGLLCPELLFLRALNEFFAAKYLLKRVKEVYRNCEVSADNAGADDGDNMVTGLSHGAENSAGQDVESQLASSEQSEEKVQATEVRARRAALIRTRKHQWTLVHTFYVEMGGIAKQVAGSDVVDRLNTTHLLWLLENRPDLLPDISTRSILDKSKADWFAKTIISCQALWFCLSSLTRLIQGLSLSLLEITTLAHVFCSFASYVLWWHKPYNVHEPTVIHFDIRPGEVPLVYDGPKVQAAALTLFYLAYVSIHAAAVNSTFPTWAERQLWIASVSISYGFAAIVACVALVLFIRGESMDYRRSALPGYMFMHSFPPSIIFLVEGIRQLWFLPPDVYQLASWSNYFPHFS